MMISRLKVELEKIKTLRENLNGYRNVFTSKLPFKDIQIDISQIKDQFNLFLLDRCTETESGLTMSG